MEVLQAGLYALIASVLVSLGLSIRTFVVSNDAISKRKNEQALFDSNLRNRELEQQLALRDVLTKATAEITEQSKEQRDLIDVANSKVASSETAIGILQSADIENRRLNAERDRLLGEQKAEIISLKADNAALKETVAQMSITITTLKADKARVETDAAEHKTLLATANQQLKLVNEQLSRVLLSQAEVKAGGSTQQTRDDHARNVADDHAATLPAPSSNAINEAVDVLNAAKPLSGAANG